MQAAKFNEFQASYGMGADTSKAREPAEKVKTEKEQPKTTQQIPHVDINIEWPNSQGETKPKLGKDLKKLDDPETQDGMTYIKIIPLPVSPKDKALDQKPWDLILETPVESAAQLSSPEPHTTERQRPQPGAVLHLPCGASGGWSQRGHRGEGGNLPCGASGGWRSSFWWHRAGTSGFWSFFW